MTRTLVSSAIVASLALVFATVPFDAIAGGGKATPPPAKPGAKPAPVPDAKYGSLAALETACDEAESEATKEMRRKRYEKVVAYVAANPGAKDAEKALGKALDLAEEIEDWAKAIEHADAYAKTYAEGARKTDAMMKKAAAMTHTGAKKEDVKKAYESAFASIDIEKKNAGEVFWSYVGFANWLAENGDMDGAKETLQKLKDVYASHAASGEVAEEAEKILEGLAVIGTAAAAIPDDVKDIDGKPVSLADFKGKVLLIDFWATWCPPCRAEIPGLVKAYQRYHDKGFEILGVALENGGDAASFKDFLKERTMTWRQVNDGERVVARAYGVNPIPHMVLIDREGKVVRVGLRGAALEKKLDSLFAGK